MEMQRATRDIWVTVSVRLPLPTYERVAEVAHDHRGNLSEALRRLLAVGLREREEMTDERIPA